MIVFSSFQKELCLTWYLSTNLTVNVLLAKQEYCLNFYIFLKRLEAEQSFPGNSITKVLRLSHVLA